MRYKQKLSFNLLPCLVLLIGLSVTGTASQALAEQTVADDPVVRMEAAGREADPYRAVELATDEIMALIRSAEGYAKEDPDRFYTEVERLIAPVVDFPRFARSVMGVYYKKATPAQREKFAESFKWTLVRTYALSLLEFIDGTTRVLPNQRPSRRPDQAAVEMEIVYENRPYQVIYAMQRKDERWQLVNILIEGINLRLNYRAQFDSAMKGPQYGRDMDRVIQAWTDVITAEAQALASTEGQGT